MPEPEYEEGIITRKVQVNGEFTWSGVNVFLSETLRGETIGLRPVRDGIWEIRFCQVVLGTVDERTRKIVPKEQPKRRRSR